MIYRNLGNKSLSADSGSVTLMLSGMFVIEKEAVFAASFKYAGGGI